MVSFIIKSIRVGDVLATDGALDLWLFQIIRTRAAAIVIAPMLKIPIKI
jgi:hypothetical protein